MATTGSTPTPPPDPAAADASDLVFAPAAELARRIRRRAISATELLDVLLAQLARHNPQLNAISWSSELIGASSPSQGVASPPGRSVIRARYRQRTIARRRRGHIHPRAHRRGGLAPRGAEKVPPPPLHSLSVDTTG